MAKDFNIKLNKQTIDCDITPFAQKKLSIYISRQTTKYDMVISTIPNGGLSLGYGNSVIEILADASLSEARYIEAKDQIEIGVAVQDVLNETASPDTSGLAIASSIEDVNMRRYRKLSEMDDNTIATYDDMSLDDIDYILV